MNIQAYSLKRYRRWILPVLVLALLVEGAALVCKVDLRHLLKGSLAGLSFLSKLFPPAFGSFGELLAPCLQSIVIALLGTFFGTVFSLFFGLAAAANISPAWLRNSVRGLLGVERAIPEIIILLVLVAAFGMGPFAGVLALTVGCVGMLGKLFGDAIEELDPATIESIEAVGAGKLQVMLYGVIHQLLPTIISFFLFRFEMSIRLSVVLGAVGAGGIGLELYQSFNLLDYPRAGSALILTLVLIMITEYISSFIRKKLRAGGVLS